MAEPVIFEVSKKIQVLHVVLSLEPGGMENGVVNLMNGLAHEQCLDMKVCCLIQAGAFARRLPADRQPVVLQKQAGFSWQTVRDLREVFRQNKPAIIHTHNLGTLIYTALARQDSASFPILHGEHAEFSPSDLSFRRRLQRWWLYRQVDKLVPVSQSLGEHLIEHGSPRDKVHAINNGVDTLKYAPSDKTIAKRKLGFGADNVVIGIVGRFGPYKRHDLLVKAFEQMAAKNPQARLLVVGGGGPEEAKIKQLVGQSAAQGKIHLAGYQAEPAAYYQAMDLLVLPSYNEGMSNAALEAMATAVPVLCHTACGQAEIIEDGRNGYVRQMENPEQLAEMLTTLLQDIPALNRTGLAGREYVVQNLSFITMQKRYLQLYQETARKWALA